MKSKIYKKITPHDSNSYLGYLNKLVYEYNNNYHHSIGKKAVDSDYSAFTEEIESNLKPPEFKVGNRARITKCKNTCSEGPTHN